MKNIFILILIFAIVFSGIMPSIVYGETVDEKILEEVVLKLKGLFGISDDYDKFDSRVDSYDDELNFNLSWSDSNEKLPYITIQADSVGNGRFKSY